MKILVGIVCHSTDESIILQTVDSVFRKTCCHVKVLLIDNSPDMRYEGLLNYYGDSVDYSAVKNYGFGYAHNFGFCRAVDSGCNLYICCNPDLLLDDNFFVDLLRLELKEFSYVPVVYDCGLKKYLKGDYCLSPVCFLWKRIIKVSTPAFLLSATPWFSGAFLIFNIQAAPPQIISSRMIFDEKYFMYFEDVDLTLRLHQLGVRQHILEDIFVYHMANRESRRNIKLYIMHIRSYVIYFFKYFSRRPQDSSATVGKV